MSFVTYILVAGLVMGTQDRYVVLLHLLRNKLWLWMVHFQYQRLQRILNAAARMICFTPRTSHITSVLMHLHWLPGVEFQIIKRSSMLKITKWNDLSPRVFAFVLGICSKEQSSDLKYDNRSAMYWGVIPLRAL
jgi:hypothetical protein